MHMTPMGTVHFIASLVGLLAGAIVLLLPKGTRWHRTCGHAYVWGMVGVVATSFGLWNMTGRFTPFHFFAIVAGLTLAAAMYTVLARRPKGSWLEAHATWMAWSYVGLCAAATAETLSRFVMPFAVERFEVGQLMGIFWTAVAGATFLTVGVGAYLVKRLLPGSIESTPQAMRREREELRAQL
jgi:uncharacterized membrane protein